MARSGHILGMWGVTGMQTGSGAKLGGVTVRQGVSEGTGAAQRT